MKRVQIERILRDLNNKMVIIAGPRQAGKTFLSQQIAKHYQNPVYLNYDQLDQRQVIETQSWLDNTDLVILDELHKHPDWKNYLKGLYDTKTKHLHVLVTGSARLELFSQIGDSLAGRYFLHHLLPFSLAELNELNADFTLEQLIERGGFPEPLFAENNLDAERWRQQYSTSLLNIDVLNFDNVKNLHSLQTLFSLLRSRVGSTISVSSLARDLALSPTTISKYIQILEALYIVFRITPFSKNIARSLLKEPKIYLFDTGLVNGDNGAKLENQVAVELLKHCQARCDYLAQNCQLNYLRDKEKREVDFVIQHNEKIETLIEVKVSDQQVSPSLRYFADKYDLPAIQLIENLKIEQQKKNVTLRRAQTYLSRLFVGGSQTG